MKASDQILMHKKSLAKPSENLSANQLTLETHAIAAVLDGMQRSIIALQAAVKREDGA